jgi:hypothetical protein
LPPRHHVEAHRASERAYTISQVFRSIAGAGGIHRQDRTERGAAAFSREKKKKVICYGTNQTSIRDWPRTFGLEAPQWNRSPIAVRVPREPHASPIRMSRAATPRGVPRCSCPLNFSYVNQRESKSSFGRRREVLRRLIRVISPILSSSTSRSLPPPTSHQATVAIVLGVDRSPQSSRREPLDSPQRLFLRPQGIPLN